MYNATDQGQCCDDQCVRQESPCDSENRAGQDRRDVVDRRTGLQRRQINIKFEGPNRRTLPDRRHLDMDRRRGPGRRRSDDRRCAEEGEMTTEQFSFIMALEQYKKDNRRPFPTWTEVLDVIKAIGYRKVAQPKDIS